MQNIGTAYWYTYVMRSTHVIHLSCIHENRKKRVRWNSFVWIWRNSMWYYRVFCDEIFVIVTDD